ncbi:store-operated calcium entry-associated regulatory factor-like isoform X1 [Dendronephthya gigantea]|uniref:store-operated calcium entry-associated regulatory factor-like isoform X1 n=1 Tax=Dendronephthya gigantea TaxID=151771 RepID=UPI00106CF83D|nr:store-operated calcium entry-associated regulatory factor-like isoform X1 [Dendronephthya gigantea]
MDSRRNTFFLLLCINCLLWNLKFVVGSDRVQIRNVEVLTLYQGKMTTGRRSTPVLQLRCSGGSAGCSAFVPQVVQCYNRGWDGYDAQWECKTDMDSKYRFGKIDVSCEGYDYPDDPYILRGSCGLEYTIELTEEGNAKKQGWSNYHGYDNYQGGYRKRYNSSSGFGELVMFIAIAVIFYMVFKTCTSNPHIDTETTAPPYNQDPNNMGRPGPSAPPPPYGPDPPGFKREYTQGHTAPPPYQEPGYRNEYTQGAAGSTTTGSATNSNAGFWTGAATGGLLGYLFGGRTRTGYHYNPYNNRGWGGDWGGGWGSSYQYSPRNSGGFFGNWFGGSGSYRPSHNSYGFSSFGDSSSSSSSPSSGSRTTSGMGGTSRR